VLIAHSASSRLIVQGWYVTQGLKSTKRYAARGLFDWLAERLTFLDPKVRLIVAKDAKSFVRDPVQWSQFLIFFGLLAIYFLNLRSFGYDDRNYFWKNIIAQMNLLATSLTLATFSSRFIYPQLSLEGRRFWVIGMVPMPRDSILFGKLALCFTTSLLISETLIVISSIMLKTPQSLAMLHAVALFGICLGLGGLSVGLGALYPNFAEDNPSKIVAGFGGTLNLVMSLAFVMVVLTIQAVPCFLYYGKGAFGMTEFRNYVALAMAAITVISLAACVIPMQMGLRAIRKLEV
jgi:ABC-2 type transport system permease protein